jgi:HAD superfamily hydrolase (TIGR01549 family)
VSARAVLFDLDDTLFDHRRSARAALDRVHRTYATAVDFSAFERRHAQFLEEMHLEVLAGRMALDEARRERFRRVFTALGIALDEADVGAVASAYRAGYLDARRAADGAAELLAYVHQRAAVAIVSNNLLDEQRDKLDFCQLAAHVDALVVSEEAGVWKPDPAIFHIALQRLGVAPGEAVMVGDSWGADIVGAARAGIRAIWFNPQGRSRPSDPGDVLEIRAWLPVADVAHTIMDADAYRY